MVRVKRVYESAAHGDGYRVLVDRIWPRGVRRDAVNHWMKEVAPSTELRKWFNHDAAKWATFKARYTKELAQKKALIAELKSLEKTHGTLTLLFGARDEERNQAVVLRDVIAAV